MNFWQPLRQTDKRMKNWQNSSMHWQRWLCHSLYRKRMLLVKNCRMQKHSTGRVRKKRHRQRQIIRNYWAGLRRQNRLQCILPKRLNRQKKNWVPVWKRQESLWWKRQAKNTVPAHRKLKNRKNSFYRPRDSFHRWKHCFQRADSSRHPAVRGLNCWQNS